MTLSRHVDPEDIISHLSHNGNHPSNRGHHGTNLTPYSSAYASQRDIPKYNIPKEGTPADAVYSMIKDELELDGRPTLNLASFVNTNIEEQSERLMIDNMVKNFADNDEYPAMISMSERCVSILAHLWGVQKDEKAIGSATVGSSEAIHLGGLAMKRRWQEKRKAAGKDTSKPNIIMGANAQVALLKFARYFDVEGRILPVSEKSHHGLDPDLVKENIDENTIGIFVILGSTYTGYYEPVEEISQILDEYEKKTGHDIPIHVDAASGGFVAPFTHAGTGAKKWNFELPRVKSINVSGHKYGLATAGLGWIIWRDESFLPKDLIFELHYLGGVEQSYTLNFSRPGAQVIVQYFNLIHLGFNGYREVMENCLANARLLSNSLEATGWYTCVSGIHKPADGTKPPSDSQSVTSKNFQPGLPVVAFRLSDNFQKKYPHIKQDTISLLMRARQWIIPNYALPPQEDKTEILRVVVRNSMSFDLLDKLVTDLVQVTEQLMDHDALDNMEIVFKNQHKRRAPKLSGKDKEEEVEKFMGKRMEGVGHRSVC
ncbi:pyridoxal phosphate-dependent transferase [Naviculisporaceae sp. PSN 640]